MKKVVVVGSGAGGATIARELQGYFDVTVVESGREYRPLKMGEKLRDALKRSGIMTDERLIQLIFPPIRIQKTEDRMVMVRGRGTGGTTTLSTANAIRMDRDLKRIGIDLNEEFLELDREVPISTGHQKKWRKDTRTLYQIFEDMGLSPMPTPKMAWADRCSNCGNCILGCPTGAKWDSRKFLDDARKQGACLIVGCHVEQVVFQNGKAAGIRYRKGLKSENLNADLIILAAGGLGTPVILQNSGIGCEPRLFIDPVLCVACRRPSTFQNREIPMPFISQQDGYMISPYFDPLSYYFNKKWKSPPENILSLMIKLADMNLGTLKGRSIKKSLTIEDREKLNKAMSLCVKILERMGLKKEDTFLGTINAGHPGGMVPLTAEDSHTMHPSSLPDNLYVSDASLFPSSLGNPPILTIMAMAKRIAKIIKNHYL